MTANTGTPGQTTPMVDRISPVAGDTYQKLFEGLHNSIRQSGNPMAVRYLAISLGHEGWNANKVAKYLGITENQVCGWFGAFQEGGIDAVGRTVANPLETGPTGR